MMRNTSKPSAAYCGVGRILKRLVLSVLFLDICFANASFAQVSEYDQMGADFANAINLQDLDQIASIFNARSFAYRTAKTVFDDQRDINAFVGGMLQNGEFMLTSRLFEGIFSQAPEARFLRTIDGTKPVIRLSYPEGGYEYIVCTTLNTDATGISMVDMLFYSRGAELSQAIGAATQLLLAPSEGLLKKIFNVKELDHGLVETFEMLPVLQSEGKYAEAYYLLQSLPEEIRISRVVLDSSVQFAQFVSDEEYLKQLSLLDQYYGEDESTAFMLIDYHFLTEDYDRANASIDFLISRIGEDASLFHLKANTYLMLEDLEQAEQYARRAIDLDPYLAGSYDALAVVFVSEERYSDLVSLFQGLEQSQEYFFTKDSFTGDEFYAGFVQSEEFRAWLN